MIEAGEVGAVFTVIDRALPVLKAIADQLLKVDAAIVKAKEGLTSLASTRFTGLNERILGVDKSLSKVGNQAARVGNEMAAGFGRAANSMEKAATAATTGLARAQAEMARLSAQIQAAQLPPPGGGGRGGSGSSGGGSGGGGGRGGHGGGGRGGIHFRAHGYGVPGGHIGVSAGGDGFMALLLAGVGLHGAEQLFHAGAELEHLKTKAAGAGMSPEEINAALDASWGNVAGNRNASVTEGLKTILELRQATGSTEEALHMLPAFTRTQNALSSIKDEGMKAKVSTGRQSYNFARSLELLGVTANPAMMDAYTSSMTRAMIGTGGLVDGNTYFQGIQNAGGARYKWNQDFISHELASLLQISPRSGNGLYQLDRSYGQGVMTEMMAQGLEKYGLFQKGDEARVDGKFKGMKPGSIINYDEMVSNPAAWAVNTVLPLLKAKGINIDDTNEMTKAVNEISRGNKNLNNILDELLLPLARKQLAKDRTMYDKVPGDAAAVLQKNDPNLQVQAFTTAWHNLMTALGDPMVGPAAQALGSMAEGINRLALIAKAHPDAVKIIGEIAAGMAAAFTVLAGIAVVGALAAFLPGGIAVVAIAGVVGALTALAAFNWESLKDLGSKAMAAMEQVGKALADAIASIPGMVTGAISGMASSIGNAISNALRSLLPGGGGAAGGAGGDAGGPLHLGPVGPARPVKPMGYYGAPRGSQAIHVQTAINVDGKHMASAMTKHLIAAHDHPRQAPYADAGLAYSPLDYGFSTG